MAPLLLGEALAQRLHQPVEAELLDLVPLLGTEIALDHPAQPFLRQGPGLDRGGDGENALEGGGEDDVELVEIALVLDEERAGQAVEFVDRRSGQIPFKRPHEVEIFARRRWDMRLAQISEELKKHDPILASPGAVVQNTSPVRLK